MLTVLIVDDENPVRLWLTYCIERSNKDYLVVGKVSNGEEAFDLFRRKRPDVVFTDITMPIMDGMELTRRIRELDSQASIVMLTCHADFQYARNAMKYGVSDYLLKSDIEDADVIALLDKIQERKKQESQMKESLKIVQQTKRDALLHKLMKGEAEDAEFLREGARLGMDFTARNLYGLVIRPYTDLEFADTEERAHEAIAVYSTGFCCFRYEENKLLILGNLLAVSSQSAMIGRYRELIAAMRSKLPCSIGASQIYREETPVRTVVKEAAAAMEQEFFRKADVHMYTSQLNTDNGSRTQLDELRFVLQEAIRQLDRVKISHAAERLFEFIEEGRIKEVAYIQSYCAAMLRESMLRLFPSSIPGEDWAAMERDVRRQAGMADLRSYFMLKLQLLLDQARDSNGYSTSVKKAIQHIREAYSELITLSKVAKQVHLNADYFGRIFKEETGKKFGKYVMDYRLEKARELLSESDLTVTEVAQKVGIPNVSHFSKIFKESSGENARNLKKGRIQHK
jgi:YesN/AraC family two-component response regulator